MSAVRNRRAAATTAAATATASPKPTAQTTAPTTTATATAMRATERSWQAVFLGAQSNASVVALVATHVNIFVYAFAYWLQQPVLGFITRTVGGDAATFGLLQSFFSAVQLVGGPAIGALADTVSPRAILALAVGAGGVSYALLAVTASIPMLFAAQLPSVAMHAMLAAQACVSVLSADSARSVALGRLSLSYGLGMVSGSALGGTLSRIYSLHTSAAVAAVVSFAVVPLTYPFLPAAHSTRTAATGAKDDDDDDDNAGTAEGAPGGLASLRLLVSPELAPIMAFLACIGLALSMQRSTFAMMAADAFGLTSEELGWTMSYGAVLALVANLVVVPLLTSAFSELNVSLMAAATLAAGFVAYAHAASLTDLIVVLIPITVASTTLYTVTTAVISKTAPPALVGSAIGLRHGLGAALGVIAPTLGNTILAVASPPALAYTCAALALAAALGGRHLL